MTSWKRPRPDLPSPAHTSILSLQSNCDIVQFKCRRVIGRGTRYGRIPSLGRTRPDLDCPTCAALGLCHNGVDAGIVFELPEQVQIVSTDDFWESCLGNCAPGTLVEKVPDCRTMNGALEHRVREEHLVRSLAFHDHLGGSLLQPRPRLFD